MPLVRDDRVHVVPPPINDIEDRLYVDADAEDD